MLEQREIKLSKVVSAFAKDALFQLSGGADRASVIAALSGQVDTLLMMTDLCRSGFQQEQQVRPPFSISEQEGKDRDLQPQPYLLLRQAA